MTAPRLTAVLTGLRPEAVAQVIDLLREQAELMTTGSPGYLDDPLSYAWLTCLEAAASVGRAIGLRDGPGVGGGYADAGTGVPEQAEDELQEAWAAARGAAMSVRLSLYRRHDAD